MCGLSGVVEHEEHADVLTVVRAIENHHDRLAHNLAPHCRFDLGRIRVRNPELMDIYAWNRMVASLDRKCNA